MTLFVLILLLIVQAVVPLVIFGVGLTVGRLRFPLMGLYALVNILDSVFLAAQFGWLFKVWYQSFVLGSIAISVAALLVGAIAQLLTNSISQEKRVRVNVSTLLLFGRTNKFSQTLSIIALVWLLFIVFKTYALSRGEVTDQTIKNAAVLFFTIGALPGLILSAIQMVGGALRPSLDPFVRNTMALASLGGYGVAAWRAAFPFFVFGGTAVIMGYQVNLTIVLAIVAITYAVFVIIPLLLGERRYALEREDTTTAASSLLRQIASLDDPSLNNSIFAEERGKAAQQLNRTLTNLYENDALLRFLAFWRWGPDRAFHREGNFWVLHDPAAESANPKLNQPLGVLNRPWFQHLIGPDKRVPRRYNDATVEALASTYLEEIPNWNYRAAIFDELVMVLEDLESDDPKAAFGRAKTARSKIDTDTRPSQERHSIVTTAFIAAATVINPVILSMFQDQLKNWIHSMLS